MDKKLNNKHTRNLTAPHQQRSSTAFPSDVVLLNCEIWPRKNFSNLLNGEEITKEEIACFSEWRKQKKFTLREAIMIFPEAKEIIKEKLQNEIRLCEIDLEQAKRLEKEYDNIIFLKSPKKDEEFWRAVVDVCFLSPLRDKQRETIKRNTHLLSLLSGSSKSKNPIGVTEEEIAHAKEYPITDLIEFKRNVACCFNHSERTPSLHYYPKNNTCHCFGACQKSFDAIDVYRLLNNCTFVEAVRKLQ